MENVRIETGKPFNPEESARFVVRLIIAIAIVIAAVMVVAGTFVQ